MPDLSVLCRCRCGTDYTIPVPAPDEFKRRLENPSEWVICRQCVATVEDLEVMGSAPVHGDMKAEPAATFI